MGGSKTCDCGKPGIYKCADCRQPYCSLPCAENHKQQCKIGSNARKSIPPPNVARSLEQRIDPDFYLEDSIELPELNDLMKQNLINSASVAALKDPSTKALVEHILKTSGITAEGTFPSRGAERRGNVALEEARRHPEFDAFCRAVLDTCGW